MNPVDETVLPFGLIVAARAPIPLGEINLDELEYDPDQQITFVRDRDTGSLVPWSRHSTGKTTTNSNTDSHGGTEKDEDYTED